MIGKIAPIEGIRMANGIQLTTAPPPASRADDTLLRKKAVELEANFLSEMLGHAGFGEMQGGFGGGIGEEQFSSFLRSAYAQKMSEAGGIGLAESIFQAMSKGAPNVRE
ncbi:rod-binding protein [Paenirhodobacter sp.]|uniref:rod-binding protein n=1 Tax=Paenirhodobacter sp. TaxID=1965326 RepID=UPI003B3D204F